MKNIQEAQTVNDLGKKKEFMQLRGGVATGSCYLQMMTIGPGFRQVYNSHLYEKPSQLRRINI